MIRGLATIATVAAICHTVLAQTVLIDFEADAIGAKANGFSAVGRSGVTFTDTVGADLSISNFGSQGIGQSLGVNSDGDGSKLQIDFAFKISSFQLSFGNDDPGYTSATDRAWLQLWDGGGLVSTVSVVMNRDDIMNQTISWTGSQADRAVFWYGDAAGGTSTTGSSVGLIEVVDQISYTPIPEPTLSGILAATAGAWFVGRKRRAFRSPAPRTEVGDERG